VAAASRRAYNHRMRGWLAVVVSLGLWLTASTAHAQAPTSPPAAADVLAEVQRFYRAHPEVNAKVRQIATTAGRSATIDGTLELTAGRLRWLQYGPRRRGRAVVTREVIGDGAQLIVFDHAAQQIRVSPPDLRLLPIAVAHVYDPAALAALAPTIASGARYGAATDLLLTLTPAAGAPFAALALVVDPSNHRIKQAVVTDLAGDTLDVRFYEPRYDRPVATVATWRLALQPQVARYAVIASPVIASPAAPAPSPAPPSPAP